jgi:hypothetical protein
VGDAVRGKIYAALVMAATVAACGGMQLPETRVSYDELAARFGEPNATKPYSDGSKIVTYNNVDYRKVFPDAVAQKQVNRPIFLSMQFEFDKDGFCTLSSSSVATTQSKPSSALPTFPSADDLLSIGKNCGPSRDGTGYVPLK